MRRFHYSELRTNLPALARGPRTRRAERYLREHFPHAAREPRAKATTARRRDGVREYTITLKAAAQGRAVPFLRMSGRWMEQCGFSGRTRVFVRVEPGCLVLTTYDPAIGDCDEQRG